MDILLFIWNILFWFRGTFTYNTVKFTKAMIEPLRVAPDSNRLIKLNRTLTDRQAISLVIKSVHLDSSWDPDSFSASKGLSKILGNPKVHTGFKTAHQYFVISATRTHCTTPLSFLFHNNFNIIFPYNAQVFNVVFSLGLWISLLPHDFHISHQPRLSCIIPWAIKRAAVHLIRLVFSYFSSSYFLLRLYIFLESPQRIFVRWCERQILHPLKATGNKQFHVV